ncbi:hypothetical protein B0H19DRAFT_1385022 [Mycena capillaripes]|nr:hypothetical protein B0H19DRAFT_1385022 [Mycena capillaripes]
MDGSQYPPYFWDGSDEQRQAPLPVDSASLSDDPPLFNFPADYGDPAGFFAQPAQPLDLPLDLFPFRPELSSSGLRQQPTGPTQYDDHAVQLWWEDFSSSFQTGYARTPSTGSSAGDLFGDGSG